MFDRIISNIRKDLKKNVNEKYRIGSTRFFKEIIKPYGVKIPVVRKIADDHFRKLRFGFDDSLSLTEKFFKSGWFEEPIVGFCFLSKFKKEYKKDTAKVFEKWLNKYISNWAHCDFLCTDLIDYFLQNDKNYANGLLSWTRSKNRWVRRASMVCFVRTARKGMYLNLILKIAKRLKTDKDDLVLKGAGWILREAAKKHRKEVYDFLIREKKGMGRVMLRYAIEHFPINMKKKVMA